jgi:hypothetical protein
MCRHVLTNFLLISHLELVGTLGGIRGCFGFYSYSFFTSVIPALTFGEYIFDATEGAYGGSQVLSGAAIGGIIQVTTILPERLPVALCHV